VRELDIRANSERALSAAGGAGELGEAKVICSGSTSSTSAGRVVPSSRAGLCPTPTARQASSGTAFLNFYDDQNNLWAALEDLERQLTLTGSATSPRRCLIVSCKAARTASAWDRSGMTHHRPRFCRA
jgi:hypothetical protein